MSKAPERAPWDKEPESAEAAPWDKPTDGQAEVVQEMHPDLSFWDRPITKNFANSPDSTVAYLKKQHPNMEVLHKNGQVMMRNPGEAKYRVLDPNTGFFSKDFLHDAGDVAYDFASGIPVNFAQKVGGALGMLTPVPGGTLMGAGAAGGMANAGSEYLKQRIGKALGIPQEVNMNDVKLAGAIGAVSPVIFGNDLMAPAARDAIKKGVEKLPALAQRFLKPLGEEEARRVSEGALKRGAIGAGSWASGIPGDTLREGYKRLAGIKHFEKEGVTDYVDTVHDEVKQTVQAEKERVGKGIQELIDKSGDSIDLASTKGKMQKLLDEYKNTGNELDTPGMKDKIEEVENTIKTMFGEDTPEKVEKVATGLMDQYGKPITKDVVTQAATKAPTKVSAKAAFELQQQLSDLAEMHRSNIGILPKNSGKALADKRLGASANEALRELKMTVQNTIDSATNKKIDAELIKQSAGQNLNPEMLLKMRAKIAENFKMLRDHKAEYADLSRLQRDIAPKFASPEKTYNTLRTLDGKSKQYLYEKLSMMDKKLGTETVDHAKTLHAFSLLSNAPTNPISGQAVTSTSKTIPLAALGGSLGYYLGANSGLGMGGAGIGMGLGASLGSKLGSPAAMRAAMEAGQVGSKALKRVPDWSKQSIWNLMQGSQGGQ